MQLNEDINTQKYSSIPTGSTVAVQKEDSRSWTHGTIVGNGTEDHNGRSYKLRVNMTRCTIIRVKKHVTATPILREDYLRNEMSKANQPQTQDKANKLVDNFLSYISKTIIK